MKCKIAEEINKGKYNTLVSKNGAKLVVKVSRVVVDINSAKVEINTPKTTKEFNSRIDSNVSKSDKLLSLYYSGKNIEEYLKEERDLSNTESKKFSTKIEDSKINSIVGDIMENVFFGDKTLSPTTNSSNRSVIRLIDLNNKVNTKALRQSKDRTFFVLNSSVIAKILKSVQQNPSTTKENFSDLMEEAMTYTIKSALYRGFDVIVSTSVDMKVINSAITSYERGLNDKQQPVAFASDVRSDIPRVIKFKKAGDFLYNIDSINKKRNPSVKIFDDVSFLNSILSEDERRTLDKFNQASNASKIVIAERIGGIFHKFIPGLSTRVMSQREINDEFGPVFANKKGFILNGEVVLNLNQFDASTIFHEFGHFYMRWLKGYDEKVYKNLLDHTRKTLPEATYTDMVRAFKAVSLNMSEEEILEELFVERLGLTAAKELITFLPFDEIVNNTFTKESFNDKKDISVKITEGAPVKRKRTNTSVVKKHWTEIKNADPIKITEDGIEINSTRVIGTKEHFGNPWTGSNIPGAIQVGPFAELTRGQLKLEKNKGKHAANIRKAVENYEKWLLGEEFLDVEPKRREWIIKQIRDNKLKGAKVLYFESDSEYISHADVLVSIINMVDNHMSIEGDTIYYSNFGSELAQSLSLDNVKPFMYKGREVHSAREAFETFPAKNAFGEMIDILSERFLGDRELLKNVTEKGGISYINRSTFRTDTSLEDAFWVTPRVGDRTGEDMYIKALSQAYSNVMHIVEKEELEGGEFKYLGTTIKTIHPLGFEQIRALEEAIDHVLNLGNRDSKTAFTIQGSAGTGKTTIIGLAQNFLKEYTKTNRFYTRSFVYMSPTHAANIQLAKTNIANGVLKYPRTLQSSVVQNRRNDKWNLTFAVKEDLNNSPNPIFILDEASMISETDYEHFVEAVEAVQGKIIFLGDTAQLPTASTQKGSSLSLTSVFNTENKSILNKVYRQSPNTLLSLLNQIRKNKNLKIYDVITPDNSYELLDTLEYQQAVFNDFKNAPEDTIFIAYTNSTVGRMNKRVKQHVTGSSFIKVGDKLVGYAGRINKSPLKVSLANSVQYIVKEVETVEGEALGGLPYKHINITSESKDLNNLKDYGISELNATIKTSILPLNKNDSIQEESFTEEDYENNNKYLTSLIYPHARKLIDLQGIAYKTPGVFKQIDDAKKSIDDILLGTDLGGNYYFTLGKSAKSSKIDSAEDYKSGTLKQPFQHLLELGKGIDYGYAITVHKSQGMTIKNVYPDIENIKKSQRGIDTPIYNDKGVVIGSLKNSLYYVALSRASNKVVINKSYTEFDEVFNDDKKININENKIMSQSVGKTVEDFMTTFLESMLGTTMLNTDSSTFDLNTTIKGLFNISYEEGGKNAPLFAEADQDALNSFRDFFIEEDSPETILSGLISKGFIRRMTNGKVILLDNLGNRVDENGEYILGGELKSFNFYTNPKDVKEKESNRKFVEKIMLYLDKFKNYSNVKFSSVIDPKAVDDIIRDASEGVELNEDEDRYVKEGREVVRTTADIEEQFGDEASTEDYVKRKIYYSAKRAFMEGMERTPENEQKAIDTANKTLEAAIADPRQVEMNRIRSIFEMKTKQGTFLHNVEELFVRALNYSITLDYDVKKLDPNYSGPMTKDNRLPYSYFMDNIVEAMSNPNKDEFQAYFRKYFFDWITDTESKEYKDFLSVYDFILDNMSDETIIPTNTLLTLTKGAFKTNIFDALPGPLRLMPEVQLYSESLGVGGKIDLIVIDRNGVAHIFDYKTKEVGREGYWNYDSDIKLKSTLSKFPNNARMKASIQTSMYKVILQEMGLETGPAHIFYIENKISGKMVESRRYPNNEAMLEDQVNMHYLPTKIILKGLIDVTSEVVEHYNSIGRVSTINKSTEDVTDIVDFIYMVSGKVNIDTIEDVTEMAGKIYQDALNSSAGGNEIIAKFVNNIDGPFKIVLPNRETHTVPSNYKTKEQRIDYIVDLLKNKFEIGQFEAKLESAFIDGGSGNVTDTSKAINGVLAGATPETHNFMKLSSNLAFSKDGSGISMLQNKVTGETRVILLHHDRKRYLSFGEGGNSKRRNVFGQFMTNSEVKAKMPKMNLANTTHDMRLIKLGLMLIKSKSLDPAFVVSSILSNRKEGNVGAPKNVDIGMILKATKKMIEVARDEGLEIPASILKYLDTPSLFDTKTYAPNSIKRLADFIDVATSKTNGLGRIFRSENKNKNMKELREISRNFDPQQDYEELLGRIIEFKHDLEMTLTTMEDKVNSDIWTLTDQVIQYLSGISFMGSIDNTTWVNNFFTTSSKSSNRVQAALNRKMEEGSLNIRVDFEHYALKKNKLLLDLAEEAGISLSVPSSMWHFTRKELFAPLFKTNNKDRKNAFILKDWRKDKLKPAQKKFLKFFEETLVAGAELTTFGKTVNFEGGWMPLLNKSSLGQKADIPAIDRARGSLKEMLGIGAFRNDDGEVVDADFSLTNRFKDQFPGKKDEVGNQWNYNRRNMLGLTELMKDSLYSEDRPLNKFEDNLENVLDTFYLSSLDTHYYRSTTALGRSLFYMVKRAEKVEQKSYDKLLETIVLMQKKNVKHEESNSQNKIIKNLNKGATFIAIAGTVNQALLETFTNPMVTSSHWLGDKLYGVMFKGNREFSAASYSKAIAIIWGNYSYKKELVNTIDRFYGITSSDSQVIKKTLSLIEKNSIFQSGHLMYINKLMLENWQKITMVAYMIEQGMFDAHGLDKEGKLVYNEKKDRRFFNVMASKEDRVLKKKMYEATKLELAKQHGGLTGSRGDDYESKKLARAWTTYDSNYIKEMIVEIYSTMDPSSKSLAGYYTELSFLTKMRTWVFAKIPRYFQKPMTAEENESMSRLIRVEDKTAEHGYNMEWRGSETEGIAFTLVSLARQAAEYKGEFLKKGELNEQQKKNVGKLLADIFVVSTLSLAAAGLFKYGLDDEDKKDPLVALIFQRWQMATGDVFLLKSLLDMTTGNSSMLITISVMKRLATTSLDLAWTAPMALVDPEVDYHDVLSAVNNVGRNLGGIYRTGELGYDMIMKE